MGGQTGLGNFAFIDGNANGVRDEGEYGVADVVVKLLNPDGSPVLNSKGNTITTTTDNQGSYSFVGIAPGEYKVMFVAPEGFTFTAANVGGDDTKNSDVDIFKFNGITKSVVIEAGDFNDTLGAGLVRPASIGNFVFDDLNGNGFRDDNEQGIAGVEINLLADTDNDGQIDDIIRTATTNADGFYEFTGLTQGDYKVQFIQPEGFDSVSPFQTGYDQSRDSDANPDANLTSNVITLQQGYNESHADAGFYKKAPGLGGSVFIDSNANGIKDDGDFNRGDIVVKLLNPDGSPALDDKGQAITTVTDNQGNYSFFNLNPGSYQVMFVAPEGFTFTTANTGSNDAVDSDAGRTGITQTVVIEDGDFNSTLNAGLVRPASIGNFVFDDLNGNGFRDDNEQGIAGVEINLLADTDNDGQIDDILETTTTDAEGFYEFTGLTQGDYKVQFIQPEGFDSVSPFQTGYDQSRDSDANPDANLTSNVITLQQGYNESHADAGFYKKAPGLGGSVFIDSNANGIKDDGDFNRGDIVVKLLNPDGSPALDDKGQAITTVTDNQGNYSFFNLKPGSNQVMFVAPEGFTFTTANTGSNDAVDSDAGRTGITQTVVIKDGDFNSTLNAGLVRPAGIGNFVFEDKNGNGIQDNGEIGISGATVTLLADTDNDGQIDDVVKTETTDSNGFYEFTGLTPGDYKVQFAQPNGFDKVSPFKAGFDATKDSNANPNNNLTTDVITLLPGRYNDQMDAGFYKSASLGNRVWYDNNRNGIQDAGERGIKGVKVTLTGGGADGKLGNADDTTAFTFTDRNGNYLFKNLSAGEEYQVTFDLPDTKKPTRTDQVNFQHRGLSENFEVDGDLTNLMVGDFDGDGKDDFIRQEKGHWARDRWNMTDVFFSKGNGTFKKKSLMQGSHYLNGNLTNLLVGDFNGDGKDDFIRQEKGHWARDRWNMTDIFFSNGNGTFKKKSLMQGSHYLNGDLTNLIVGDFNGDGKDDFIRQEKGHWARDRWNMTDVFFSNGNGTFRRQSLMQGSSFLNGNLTNLIVGDFNGDGKDDFMRQEKGHWANDRVNMNQIFFSNGNGTFEKVDVLKNTGLLNGNLTNVLTGDFNGNGKDGFIRQEKGYWDDDRIFTADVYLNNSTTTQAQAYAFTPQNVGSNDAVDSDTNPTTGMTQIVTLASGANNSTLDTGIYKKPQYSVNFNFVHSPIALDLTGDGIQTISIDEGVTFDMLETGNAVNTGWLSGEDGFLAVDNNGDGLISSRGELFGGLVGEGFAKLESFDTNGDGLVNEADDLFADLRLWQDINQNGVTDSGELVNLATAGITDLVTGHTDVFSTDAAGNIHGEHSFAKRNGSTIDMVDVYFQVNG